MSIFTIIEKIRQESDSKKKKISFITAFSVTALIAIVWFSVIGNQIFKTSLATNPNEESLTAISVTPFDSIKNRFEDLGDGIRERFSTLKDSFGDKTYSNQNNIE